MIWTVATVTTPRRGKRGRRGRGTSARSRASESGTEPAAPPAAESVLETLLEQPEPEPSAEVVATEAEPALPTSAPEPRFAAMVPPPAPVRPLPAMRRVIFFDVENTSRAEHIQRVLTHLGLDWSTR